MMRGVMGCANRLIQVQDALGYTAYTYDLEGNLTSLISPMGRTESYAYNAENDNPGTELAYLRARYYDTGTGRFTTEDTWLGDICDPLTLNRYAYAKNNLVNDTDPSGHLPKYMREALSECQQIG